MSDGSQAPCRGAGPSLEGALRSQRSGRDNHGVRRHQVAQDRHKVGRVYGLRPVPPLFVNHTIAVLLFPGDFFLPFWVLGMPHPLHMCLEDIPNVARKRIAGLAVINGARRWH